MCIRDRAYIPKKNELSQQEYISFQDLEGQSLHMFSSDFSLYGQVVAGCQQAGFQPNISSTSSQRHFLIDMAQSTNGIALMPRPIVAKLTYPAMCIRPFVPKFPWTISIILKRNKYITKAMAALLSHIEDFFQTLRQGCLLYTSRCV